MRRRLVFRHALAVSLTVIVLLILILVPWVEAAVIPLRVVGYDLPSYSKVNQTRTIKIHVSPFSGGAFDPPQSCSLTIISPDGATRNITAYPDSNGYASFSYTPNTLGQYTIAYFYYPGDYDYTSRNSYSSVFSRINHLWTVTYDGDTTVPSGSVIINNNDERTNSAFVLLAVSAGDDLSVVTSMRFTNDVSGGLWSPWEPYTVFNPAPSYVTSKNWSLTTGDGSKTVYVQFMNEAGLISQTFSDEIYLASNPTNSSISCLLSDGTILPGESTQISGQLFPALQGETISIRAAQSGGSWITIQEVQTSVNGEYSYVWSPSTAGTWLVMASWAGNSETPSCESQVLTLAVGSNLSTLSLSSSTSAAILGESITFSGTLSPSLNHVEIRIMYRSDDNDWSILDVVYTDAEGRFSYSVSPETAGTYQVQAIWEGDGTTPSCQSPILTISIAEGTPWTLYILIIAIGAFALPAAGIAIHSWGQHPRDAYKTSEKLNKELEEKNYEHSIEEIDNLIKEIKKLVSLGKLPAQINEPPYSLAENLQSAKETLLETSKDKTIEEFLVKSELRPYIAGIACVLNTFKNLIGLKPPQWTPSSSKFFVPLVSQTAKAFDKVNEVDLPGVKDFWFIWEKEECEPIRMYLADEKTVAVRSRWHWKHIDIQEPYLDDKGRIEVLILPHFHTPIIRRAKEDVCFLIFAKCYCAIVQSYMLVLNEEIDKKYTVAENKPYHWPPVNYPGWYQ